MAYCKNDFLQVLVRHYFDFVYPFPSKAFVLCVCNLSFLKTLSEVEKLLVKSNDYLSFFHSVFYPFLEHSAIFIKFHNVFCELFIFGRLLIFFISEMVNPFPHNDTF